MDIQVYSIYNIMQIVFPSSLQNYQRIKTRADLCAILNSDISSSNLSPYIKYKITSRLEKYLYANCRYCKAYLNFKREQNQLFTLVKANINHRHRKIKTPRAALIQFIESLPNQLKPYTIMKMVMGRFNVAKSTFYRIYNQVKNKSLNIQQLTNSLNQHGFFGYYQPLEVKKSQSPSLLMVVSRTSRKIFQKYGDFTTFDFTYNLFKDKSPNQQSYRLGIFAGLSASMKILPFGFVICDSETKQCIAKIFYQFFKILGKAPHTIITDEQLSFKAGLDILRYQNIWDGQHLHDSFHLLRNVRRNLDNKQNLRYFSNLISAKSKNSFDYECRQAKQKLSRHDFQIFVKFVELHKQSCYSETEPQLIGFGTSSSSNQKLSDMIKTMIPTSLFMMVAAKKLALYFDKLAERNASITQIDRSTVQKYFGIPELKIIKKEVCKKVLEKLLTNITQSISCEILQQSIDQYEIKDQFGNQKVKRIETQERKNLSCSCLYLQKAGIPCCHICKVLLIEKQAFKPYISKRWNIFQFIEKKQESRRSIGRKTRRNLIK